MRLQLPLGEGAELGCIVLRVLCFSSNFAKVEIVVMVGAGALCLSGFVAEVPRTVEFDVLLNWMRSGATGQCTWLLQVCSF